MNNLDLTMSLQRFAILLIPMLLGIICHEVAHGWAALRQGDPTAAMVGRLTLNPRKHLDPMGSAFFLLTFFTGSPVVIGWAKPVPINPRRFRHYRQGMITVSVAGSLANFTLAVLFGLGLFIYTRITGGMPPARGSAEFFIGAMLFYGISINATLAWFNLIPIPPLDGSKILANILPRQLALAYESIARYGFIILIALMFFGLFRVVLWPLVSHTVSIILRMYGLHWMPWFF